MKHVKSKTLVLMAVGFSLLYSCAKDDSAVTPSGDSRDSFVGTWKCDEKSQTQGNSVFTVTITRSSNSDEILMTNFYNIGAKQYVIGTVSNSSLSIESQTVDQLTFSGSGSYSGGAISLQYTVKGAPQVDNVTAKMTKQ